MVFLGDVGDEMRSFSRVALVMEEVRQEVRSFSISKVRKDVPVSLLREEVRPFSGMVLVMLEVRHEVPVSLVREEVFPDQKGGGEENVKTLWK